MAPHALSISVPQPTVRHLLRKPWVAGAGRLPWQIRVLSNYCGCFYTVLGWPGLLPLDTLGPCMRPRCCTNLVLTITLRPATTSRWACCCFT